jgi:serine protease AprX
MVRRHKIVVFFAIIIVCFLLITFLSLALVVPLANTWIFSETQIEKLHAIGLDGTGVTIGLICTGVDVTHPEFDTSHFSSWLDLINGSQDPYDDVDHGTHLAGILAAQGSYEGLFSGVHLQGIAPRANLVVVKAVSVGESEFGQANATRVAQAIEFCIEQKVDIICLGLGPHPELLVGFSRDVLSTALEEAHDQGIIVIAPAGDDGQNDDGDAAFPSTISQVFSIGSVGSSGRVSSFSSSGYQFIDSIDPHKKPELVAPGESILSTRTYGSYGEISGTCQAVAIVTGITALLLQAYQNHNITSSDDFSIVLKEVYATTAKKTDTMAGEYAHDDRFGYGIIQGYEAYEALALYS